MTTQQDHLPTHDLLGWGGGREGALSWWGEGEAQSQRLILFVTNPAVWLCPSPQ